MKGNESFWKFHFFKILFQQDDKPLIDAQDIEGGDYEDDEIENAQVLGIPNGVEDDSIGKDFVLVFPMRMTDENVLKHNPDFGIDPNDEE